MEGDVVIPTLMFLLLRKMTRSLKYRYLGGGDCYDREKKGEIGIYHKLH